MPGKVIGLYRTDTAGAPMERHHVLTIQANKGVLYDRYSTREGSWSKSSRETRRDITLISEEAIIEANKLLEFPFEHKHTRRNVIVRGLNVNHLIGMEFTMGTASFKGVELCDPCDRIDKLSGIKGFKEAFCARGGLRAQALSDGYVVMGAIVTPLPGPERVHHILLSGRPLCNFDQNPPADWPPEHDWIAADSDEVRNASCFQCRQRDTERILKTSARA